LDLLVQVLADGKIIGDEAKSLSKLAGEAGLGRSQVVQLHESFIRQLRSQAEADGEIDSDEMKQIESAIKLLSL
jgi:DNA polymerase-3 subunit epsilon